MAVKQVPDDGPLDAKIVVIGESPGATEMIEGRPFVGASGRRLNSWLQKVGLNRDDIRVMNTVPYKVVVAKLSREDGEKWAADLHRRLAELTDPWILVPMGTLALWALTGKGKVPWHMRDGRSVRPGITDWRGSILKTTLEDGRQVKTIPTIHPAATFARQGMMVKKAQQYLRACIADWRRIAVECQTREVNTPHSEHHINPTVDECYAFLREVEEHAEVLSVDIETPYQSIDMVLTTSGWRAKSEGFTLDELVNYKSGKKKGQLRTKKGFGPASIACIGFAYRPEFSITIPVRKDTRDVIAQLLTLPVPKVMQNGCVPGSVEVLTPLGWKRLDRLKAGETIAQCQINGSIEWTSTLKKHRYPYQGDLLQLKTSQHNCLYTPNHRLLLYWQSTGKPVVREAETVSKMKTMRLPVAGSFTGGVERFPLIKLLVAIQADGNISKNRVYFQLKKERKIKRLLQLARDFGVTVNSFKARPNVVGISLSGRAVEESIELLTQKKLWGPWLLNFDQVTLREFIDELSLWDGTTRSTYTEYQTKIEQNAEWAATAASLVNVAAHLSHFSNGMFNVSFKKRNWVSIRKEAFQSIPCFGFVYCVTVPSGFFLARSNGNIFITGNSFDSYWLRSDGYEVKNFDFDCRAMHHLLDPTAPHSLQYLGSIYTRRPYWKSEAKSPEEVMKYASNFDALQTYCGMDVCGTLEIFWELHRRLERLGLVPFYLRHYRDLIEPLLDISMHGIRVDEAARVAVRDELAARVAEVEKGLEEAAGRPLVAKTGISNQRLKKYLYEDLKLPIQRKRNAQKKMAVTTDEVAIRKLMEMPAGKEKLATSGPFILMHRETKKKMELVADGLADKDGRLRCGIGFITDTGRLTSQETPKGTGRNLMNVDRKMRKMFVADE